jgi:Golgi nucleoside diphosphatase
MSERSRLEKKFSIILAHHASPIERKELEFELISEFMQDITRDVDIEPEYESERLHTWKISDDGLTDGQLSTYQWDDGELDCSLTFLKYEMIGEGNG